jgi:3-deoxy-D-manno-octulosonic-acid transferase
MLKIYQILSTLLIPVIILNIFIRIYRKKEDRLRFIERFGKPTVKKNSKKKFYGYTQQVLASLNLQI